MERRRELNWATLIAVGMIVLAVALVIIFDIRTGGEATPDPFVGRVGTPVRGTFVPDPTREPEPTLAPGEEPSPTPLATAVTAPGDPAERDEQRRADLLRLLGAANEYRNANGEYPTTGGNVQTLCAYIELDAACVLEEILGEPPPADPLGDPLINGYWYESDGDTVRIFAALEREIPEAERCPTDNVDLRKKSNLICITGP